MPSADHHVEDSAVATGQAPPTASELEQGQGQNKLVKFYSHPWTQIILISMICFCLPGVRYWPLKYHLQHRRHVLTI